MIYDVPGTSCTRFWRQSSFSYCSEPLLPRRIAYAEFSPNRSLPHIPLEHRHELLHQPGVVHPHAGADEVAVHDHALVHVVRAALLGVELALRHGCDRAALDDIGGGENLDAVADAGDGLVRGEEVARDAEQVFVVAQIFRRAPAGDEQAAILLRLHVAKGHGGADVIGVLSRVMSHFGSPSAVGGISCSTP